MTKQLYCVIDAGGNIYEHTFHKNMEVAKWKHITKSHGLCSSISSHYYNELWQSMEENGDKIILCDINTKYDVDIKIKC